MAERLSPNWFAEGTIDLEYKRYVLLAYLKQVDDAYRALKLYPHLSEVIGHHRTLLGFAAQKEQLAHKLARHLVGIDLQNLALLYARAEDDPAILQELDAVVAYALPMLEAYLLKGREIYDYVEQNLQLYPIGVVPLYTQEGYLLIRIGNNRTVSAYRFRVSSFYGGEEKRKGIAVHYVTNYSATLTQGYEQMKRALIATEPELPNPATYALESELAFPRHETLLPIAKRRLLQEVEV